MRFSHRPRCAYTVTDRKRAAAVRLQRRQRDSLPLLAPLIGTAQPSIDVVMAERVVRWQHSQQDWRDRQSARWRRGRRLLDQHAPPIRRALLDYWNGHRWLPGDPGYLLDMLHGFTTGRLILVDGKIRPAVLTIPVSAATAAFGTAKPRARGWFAPCASSTRSRPLTP